MAGREASALDWAAAWHWLTAVLWDSLGGLAGTVGLLVAIIVPLMIAIEVLKEWGALDWLSGSSAPVVKRLGLSAGAAFPLVSGIVFGLAYGAGVILESARDGRLGTKDRMLLTVFLVAAHAVIEDTLLFVPFGVNPFLLVGSRLLLAIALTVAASRLLVGRQEPAQKKTGENEAAEVGGALD